MGEKWSLYYRGSFANWIGFFNKKPHKGKITNPLISRYLEIQEKLNDLISEMNLIEKEAEGKFPLLNVLPTNNGSDNDTILDELVIYINAKSN
jgi:hypothetical protein